MEDGFRLLQERVAYAVEDVLRNSTHSAFTLEELTEEVLARNNHIYQQACLVGNGKFRRINDAELETIPDRDEVKTWVRSTFKMLCEISKLFRDYFVTNWKNKEGKYAFSPWHNVHARQHGIHNHPMLEYGPAGN